MGFKENLKSELSFQDMMVKELADKTGINKCTLDNYLREKHSAPTAENALKIAKALDVSVEYLITGENSSAEQPLTPEQKTALNLYRKLNAFNRQTINELLHSLVSRQSAFSSCPSASFCDQNCQR